MSATRFERVTLLAEAMMATRPDLEPASLDDWVLTHHDRLSDAERRAATAILDISLEPVPGEGGPDA